MLILVGLGDGQVLEEDGRGLVGDILDFVRGSWRVGGGWRSIPDTLLDQHVTLNYESRPGRTKASGSGCPADRPM